MKAMRLFLTFVLLAAALFCVSCAGSGENGNATPDEEQQVNFSPKGGSTVGNPSEVEIRVIARNMIQGNPKLIGEEVENTEWNKISLGVHNVFLSGGVWNSTTFGEELISDSGSDVMCSISERSTTRFVLEAPPDMEFSSLDLRLSKDSQAFTAEGVFDGRKIRIETGLFGLLPFSAQHGNFRWKAEERDSLIAVLDTSAMISPETFSALADATSGDITVDLDSNQEFLSEINRSIIAAFRLYRDLDGDGILDTEEEAGSNLLSTGNPDRAENWDQVWPAMTCENMEESGWENLSQIDCKLSNLEGDNSGNVTAVCEELTSMMKFDGEHWSGITIPEQYYGKRVYDVWKRGDGADVLGTIDGILVYKNRRWRMEMPNVTISRFFPVSTSSAYGVDLIKKRVYLYKNGKWRLFSDIQKILYGSNHNSVVNPKSSGEIYDGFISIPVDEFYLSASESGDVWMMLLKDEPLLWQWVNGAWADRSEIIEDISDIYTSIPGNIDRSFGFGITEFTVAGENWLVFQYADTIFEWDNGEIRHYSFNDEEKFTAIKETHVLDRNDIWAAGYTCYINEYRDCSQYESALFHFDGIDWNRIVVDSNSYILKIWGNSPDSIWFSGVTEVDRSDGLHSDYGMLWKWDGTELKANAERAESSQPLIPPTRDYIELMWGNSSDNLFISTSGGEIYRFSSGTWAELDSGLMGWPQIIKAKRYGTDEAYFLTRASVENQNFRLLHFDGQALEETLVIENDNSDGMGYFSLTDFFVAAGDDIWLGGAINVDSSNSAGITIHWDGSSMEKTSFENMRTIEFMDGIDSDHIWIMGPDGRKGSLKFWNGSEWKNQWVSLAWEQEKLLGIYPFAADDVWGITSTKVVHYNGHTWRIVKRNLNPEYPRAIHGFGVDNLFIACNRGSMLQWNGSEWSESYACTNRELSSILGLAGRELWLGGEAGTLLRYAGE